VKAKGITMSISPRVLSSAQLPYTKGSFPQRNEQIQHRCEVFSDWLLNQYWQRRDGEHTQILPKEVRTFFKQTYPDVKIKVKDNLKNSNAIGMVDAIIFGTKNTISGFKFIAKSLGNSTNVHSLVNYMTLSHEHYHLADDIINSKKSARYSEFLTMFPQGSKKRDVLEHFYDNTLYESNSIGIDKSLPDEIRTHNIKNHIGELFEKFSSNERINILQHWRNNIGSEVGAYKEGAKTVGRILHFILEAPLLMGGKVSIDKDTSINFSKIPTLKREAARKSFINEVVGNMCFDSEKDGFHAQKYQILNNMLRDEISAHRKAHAKSLKAKP